MENARPQKAGTSARDKRHFNPLSDLFPESLPPISAAIYPTAGTRADDALQAVCIGPVNQSDYKASWRLGASIKALQYEGWVFIKRDILKPGCRSPIVEYSLDPTAESNRLALASRQKGHVDSTLAALVAFAGVCAALAIRWPL